MKDEYENLAVTDEFAESLTRLVPPVTNDDLDGILDSLDELDAHPAKIPGSLRLHRLDRELADWWSITPLPPADPGLRVLIQPTKTATGRGLWKIGPVTWHYAR